MYVDFSSFRIRWEFLWQQSLLYTTCNTQLTLNGCFLIACRLQSFHTANSTPYNICHQRQPDNKQEHQVEAYLPKTTIDLTIVTYHRHRPSCLTLHWGIEDIVLLTLLINHRSMATLSVYHLLIDKVHRRILYARCHLLNGMTHHKALNWTNHQTPRTGNHDIKTGGIDGVGIDDLGQPVERHISAKQCHNTSVFIAQLSEI